MNIELGTTEVHSYPITKRPVFIDEIARARHTYISGQTGTGKSALELNIAAQIAQQGGGFAFFDPHGENATELVSRIPTNRANDLVFIDLADLSSPVGLNFIAGIEPDRRSVVADNIVTAFVHIFGKEAVADRSQQVLRNSLLALMQCENESLLSVIRLLRSEKFRRSVIGRIHDPLVLSYWRDEFESYDDRFREQVIGPILNKLEAALSHLALRHTLSQPTCSVNFRMMMDEGRILIIQLRKGSVGEQASRIMGALLFAEIMRAALSRDDIKEKERRPFDCIVDEFQSFITTDIATVLSEARKYRLYLTIANQFLEQIPDNVRPAIFGNAGTYIAFRPGADDAVVLNQQFQGKGPAQFLNLPNFKAWVRPLRDGVPDGPIQIETHPPVPPLHDRAEGLLDNSRMRFGMPREKIEKTIRRLFEA